MVVCGDLPEPRVELVDVLVLDDVVVLLVELLLVPEVVADVAVLAGVVAPAAVAEDVVAAAEMAALPVRLEVLLVALVLEVVADVLELVGELPDVAPDAMVARAFARCVATPPVVTAAASRAPVARALVCDSVRARRVLRWVLIVDSSVGAWSVPASVLLRCWVSAGPGRGVAVDHDDVRAG